MGLAFVARWVEAVVADLCRWRWRSYDDYLRSWVWRSKRRRALRRFDGACAVCNASSGLELHHRGYAGLWGHEDDSDLTLLCSGCHGLYHSVQGTNGRRRRRFARR